VTGPDAARFAEAATVQGNLPAAESIRWLPRVRVDKFTDDQAAYVAKRLGDNRPVQHAELTRFCTPYEVVEAAGNLLTTAGLTRITSLIIGAGGQAVTNTAARMGVGNSTTAEAVGQTDLQAAAGSTNRWFQVMDATYPQVSAGVITFKATFASGDGNFVWNEWGIDIGTPTVTSGNTVNATLLNRKVQSLGTKVSGSWVLTSTITLA
jgi:hypothetical protein